MYSMFSAFHGHVEGIISKTVKIAVKTDGTDKTDSIKSTSSSSSGRSIVKGGWITIADVAALRKRNRKLNQQLKQLYQDVEVGIYIYMYIYRCV